MAKVTNAPALSDPRKRWLRPNTSQYQQSSYARTYNPQGQQYSQGYTPPDNYAGTPFEGDDGTPYRPAGNDQWEAENQPVSYAENPEWDYQNPPVGADGRPLGMNNQPLPEGAQGWTPFGEPDWGPGFNGWWKGALYDIYDNPEKAVIKDLDYWQAQKDFWGNLAQGKPLEAIQASFGFWQDAAQNLNSLGAEKQYDAAGNLLESRPTMLTYLSRAIGETIQGAGQLADVAAQTVESGLGTVAGTLQDLGEGSPIPEDLFSADYDKLKEIGLQAESGEWRLPNPFTLGKKSWDLGWVQTLGSMTFGVPYNAVRALTAPQKSWDEVKDTFQENWQASRIAYSALNDEALKQEFISRYKAGEDPRLLAMELGQPWQELAGKFVADPLNLLGGSAKKGADMLDNAADVFKPAPEIQAVMDGIRNAPEMGDAASTRKLQDLVTGAMQATENRLTDLAKNVQVFGSTATSKRANTLKRVGLTLDNIIGASTRADGTLDAEKTLEQIQNLVQLTSRNADEVTQALGTVLGGARKGAYDAGALLSTAGQETGLVLRRLLQDEEGVVDVGKFIDSLTEARASGSAAVAELVNKKLAPALEEMFPTTLERVSALEDLKAVEAGKKTVEADELARLQRLASLGNPGPLAPFFARVHQSSRPFYNAVNGFLSGVYMGMSPGYAFRNAIGNNFQTFVDLGIGAWKKFNPDEMAELGFKWGDEFRANRALGGISSSAAAEGITGLRNPVEAKGFIQGMMEALKGGDDLNLFEKYGQSMLRLGEYFEQNAAKRIVGYAIDRAMTALTPKAVPVAELTRIAGLTDPQARTFQQLLLRYNGDLEAAFKGLRATENVSLKAVLLNGVNADDIQILKDYDIWNDFVKSLDDVGSRDHLFNTMDEAVTQLQEVARGVKSEHVAAGDDEFAQVIQAAEGLADNTKALNTNKYTANSHAWKAYRDATNTVFEEAYKTRLNAGQPIDDLVALRDEYKDWFTGVREASTMEQGTQFRESFIAALSELDGKRPDLTALWKRIGLPGDPPANLARKEFRAAAWDYYFGTQNERWISYRDEVVVQLETLVKRLGEANPGLNTKPMENARKLWQEARALDDAVMAKSGGLDVMKPIQGWVNDSIAKGNTQNAIRYLAQRYGIGQPNAKLNKYYDNYIAAVLKKYGGVTDPATATLEQAWRAFEARLATKQKLPQIENLTAWLGKYGETVPGKTAAEQVAELIRPATEAKIGERVYTNQIENTWEVGTVEGVTGDGRIVIRTDNPVMGAETVSASRYIPASEVKKPVASFKYTVPSEAKKAVTETILNPPASPGVASLPRTLKESLPGLTQYLDELKVKLDQNWGNYVGGALTKEQELSLSNYLKTVASPKMQEARRLAGAVAEAQRKFTILDYADRTNFDLALSMVMPYHFWYSRTYGNWMKRFMQNPKLLADYARYRETLEQIHADAPEWWRYNINTNELLGVDMKNPWYFNLEATLNPLNGLTGVDFSDPAKRVNWWTRTLDDVSKFGPSVWMPFTLATAYALYNMGEKDAAARWGGRLFPQTATLKAIGSLANVNLPFAGPHNEYDPAVNFFSGGLGLDPYEQRRVSRALGTLAQQGVISDEQAIDAAWAQSGDLYDQAVEYALDQRAIPQLQSFFMGVGFKGRTQTDIQIDQMYEQYYSLWNMAPNLKPDEFREQMELMRTQYPWMDAVILAKKSGPERDRALAYNVLSRVPPGQSGDILALFNLSDEQMAQFYENKGDLSYMTAPDRARFMAGIAELGAALSLPADATRMEWTEVRNRYTAMQDAGAGQFGADVWDRMSDFFALQRANPEAAKLMLAQNPRIQAALDWREQAVMADPLLFDYYGGLDFLDKFWQGEMYDAARQRFGESIFETSMQYGALADQEAQLLQQYYDLKDAGDEAGAKAFRAAWLDKDSNQKALFLAAHPELKAYWDLKKDYQEEIARRLVEFEPKLRDVSPELRPDYQPEGIYEMPAAAELGYQFPAPPTWADYQATLSDSQERLLMDYFANGQLNPSLRRSLESMASEVGMTYQELLQQMESAYFSEQVAVP